MIFNDPSACLKTDLSALYLVLLLKNMVLEQDVQHILTLVDLNLQWIRGVSIFFQIGQEIVHNTLHIFTVHLNCSRQFTDPTVDRSTSILPVKELPVTQILCHLLTGNCLQLQFFFFFSIDQKIFKEPVRDFLDLKCFLSAIFQILLKLLLIFIAMHIKELQITDQRSQRCPQIVRHGCHQLHIGLLRLRLHLLLFQKSIFQCRNSFCQTGNLIVSFDRDRIFQIASAQYLKFTLQLINVTDLMMDHHQQQ